MTTAEKIAAAKKRVAELKTSHKIMEQKMTITPIPNPNFIRLDARAMIDSF